EALRVLVAVLQPHVPSPALAERAQPGRQRLPGRRPAGGRWRNSALSYFIAGDLLNEARRALTDHLIGDRDSRMPERGGLSDQRLVVAVRHRITHFVGRRRRVPGRSRRLAVMGSRALRLLSLGAAGRSQCHSQQADYSIMSNYGCPAGSVLPRMQRATPHAGARITMPPASPTAVATKPNLSPAQRD